jgi:hypothetical protein
MRMRVHLAGSVWAFLTPDKKTKLADAPHVRFVGSEPELVIHGEGSGWLWVDGTLRREADGSITVLAPEA